MESYEINKDTCAVIGVNDNVTKIIEREDEYYVDKNCYEVMEDSCQYYGSSCEGRFHLLEQAGCLPAPAITARGRLVQRR